MFKQLTPLKATDSWPCKLCCNNLLCMAIGQRFDYANYLGRTFARHQTRKSANNESDYCAHEIATTLTDFSVSTSREKYMGSVASSIQSETPRTIVARFTLTMNDALTSQIITGEMTGDNTNLSLIHI